MMDFLEIPTVGLSLEPEMGSLFDFAQLRGSRPEYFVDLRSHEDTLEAVLAIKPSAIIHLAAQPLVLASYSRTVDTFQTNAMGTAHLLEACRSLTDIRAIGIVTTDKVYRNSESGRRYVESDALGGQDPYSASKVATEAVVSAYRTILGAETPLVALRAGNVIGGGDVAENRLLPDLIKAWQRGEPATIRNPESVRPWQHVIDPLLGYLIAMESMLAGVTNLVAVNFGPRHEDNLNVSEVAKHFSEISRTSLVINQQEASDPYEAKLLHLDSSKAEKFLHWLPIFSVLEAVDLTFMWWQEFARNDNALAICAEQIANAIALSSHRRSYE
jgi:CDP-glucose 4,6-dehydratase